MESLALLVSVLLLTVASLGPLAILAYSYGFIYIGGSIGLVAIAAGLWCLAVVPGPVAYIGLVSASLGAYALLQALRHDSAQ